jgi:hypothetical protein
MSTICHAATHGEEPLIEHASGHRLLKILVGLPKTGAAAEAVWSGPHLYPLPLLARVHSLPSAESGDSFANVLARHLLEPDNAERLLGWAQVGNRRWPTAQRLARCILTPCPCR